MHPPLRIRNRITEKRKHSIFALQSNRITLIAMNRATLSRLFIVLTLLIVTPSFAADPALPQIPDKSFSVSEFGAKGDGNTIDSLAINKAIETAATNQLKLNVLNRRVLQRFRE